MKHFASPNRRHLLAGLGALGLAAATPARAQSTFDADQFGIVGDLAGDQSAAVQQALLAAGSSGRTLILPPGKILVRDLSFPASAQIEGSAGRTVLAAWQDGRIGRATGANRLTLIGLGFAADESGPAEGGLLEIEAGSNITITRCAFSGGPIGLGITDSNLTISDCDFTGHSDAAIHAMDSRGLLVTGNRISRCGNAGIRIWRSQNGSDGSIVTANRIEGIDWRGGGNGQNGNGINIFKADEVIIADNRIADCAFTAVRLNSTNNTAVTGNVCLRSGEVAIFSEFAFSGSVIANNIVDGAASGISMTNLDSGGQLAVCSGNIVRNITPSSAVNPDTNPIGIFAEAEAAVTGNTVQNVPGIAIAAGFGPFLRNVLISGNVVSASDIGIGVSVVEGAGPVHIADNLISAPLQHAAVGLRWTEIIEPDLFTNAGQFSHVTVAGNVVGPA
jgi:uncharacterized secreted repeat protein (TIGR03808 family)